MANKRVSELPDAALPILKTDKILVSRDSLTLSKSTVGDLPLPLTTQQSSRGDVTGVIGSTSDGKFVTQDGNDRFVNYGLTPSNIMFCIGGMDSRGNFSDKSGKGATCLVESGNTGAFANDMYMSTIAATDGGLTIPNNRFTWNPATESLIHHFMLRKATPASNEAIVAFGGGNSSVSQHGYYVSHRTGTGALKIAPVIAGVVVNVPVDSTLSFSSTTRDVSVSIVYDAPTGIFSLYKDGILSDTFNGNAMIGANAFPNANIAYDYQIGGFASNSTSASTVATLTYGHQAYKFTGSLPVNTGSIISALAANPRIPLITA